MGVRALWYRNIKQCWLSHIFMIIILMIYSCVFFEKNFIFFAFIVLISCAMSIGVDLQDEKSNFNSYYETLPISRTTHFMNNIFSIVVGSVVFTLISLAATSLYSVIIGSGLPRHDFSIVLSGLMFGLGLAGILIVIKYKFGSQVAGVLSTAFGGLLGGLVGFSAGLNELSLEAGTGTASILSTTFMCNLILATVGFVVFALCILLAQRIYINKEI